MAKTVKLTIDADRYYDDASGDFTLYQITAIPDREVESDFNLAFDDFQNVGSGIYIGLGYYDNSSEVKLVLENVILRLQEFYIKAVVSSSIGT